MAQLVAQIICTDKVAGSIPACGSKNPFITCLIERWLLHKHPSIYVPWSLRVRREQKNSFNIDKNV